MRLIKSYIILRVKLQTPNLMSKMGGIVPSAHTRYVSKLLNHFEKRLRTKSSFLNIEICSTLVFLMWAVIYWYSFKVQTIEYYYFHMENDQTLYHTGRAGSCLIASPVLPIPSLLYTIFTPRRQDKR